MCRPIRDILPPWLRGKSRPSRRYRANSPQGDDALVRVRVVAVDGDKLLCRYDRAIDPTALRDGVTPLQTTNAFRDHAGKKIL
jgi:hypothetical protein